MDNDNKVTLSDSKRHSEVLLFLNQELSKLQDNDENNSYNLETEFAKTKKNHNHSILVILIVSFLAVFLLGALISVTLTKQNNNLTVSMNSFDDLNLKSLIDTVSSAQTNYDNAVKTKIRLEVNYESAIKAADTQKENDIYILDSLKLKSKNEYNNRLQKIENDYSAAVAKAHQDYDEEISAAQKEVELYQEQLKQFDASKVQAAQEQQKALDSERELRILEQKKITDKYDAQISQLENKITELTRKNTSDMRNALGEMTERYEEELRTLDPVIYDAKADVILTETKNSSVQPFDAEAFIQTNEITSDAAKVSYEEYEQLLKDYNYLEDSVKKVPYKNSVPKYLSASRTLVNQMNNALANGSAEINKEKLLLEENNRQLENEVENQKKQVSEIEQQKKEESLSYEAALEILLNTVKTQGVIISAVSADNIKVYVGSKYQELVTEEGISAEIKGTKTIKGKIIKADDNSFRFTSGVDKNGVPEEIDVTAIFPGATIKLSAK